jgi:hypothetical protein
MPSSLDNEIRAKLRVVMEPIERKTKWIGKVFTTYLKPISPTATICDLGVGQNCEELLHLRNYAGTQAHIFAVDVLPLNTVGKIILNIHLHNLFRTICVFPLP